jgi:DNA replication initiation complex subunit (GINS family)
MAPVTPEEAAIVAKIDAEELKPEATKMVEAATKHLPTSKPKRMTPEKADLLAQLEAMIGGEK